MALPQTGSKNKVTDSESLKFKRRIAERKPAVGNIKDVEIAVTLKYFSNIWRTLEMLLISWKINLMLTWAGNCVNSRGADTKLYVPVATLPTLDDAKLPETLKSGLKRTIHRNKYQSKVKTVNAKPVSKFIDWQKKSPELTSFS